MFTLRWNLFTPILPGTQYHPNFQSVANGSDDWVRHIINGWMDGFLSRAEDFVLEFQRNFNGPFWELYLHAVLKALSVQIDYSISGPRFECPSACLAVEPVIAGRSHAVGGAGSKILHLSPYEIDRGYLDMLARLSSTLEEQVLKYRHNNARARNVLNQAYVIAIANYGTFDSFQTEDALMQHLLYNVGEDIPIRNRRLPVATGLFRNGSMRHVSAILYSSLATVAKAHALSKSPGPFVFHAVRVRNNCEPVYIADKKGEYAESLCDGLRLYHNPGAAHPLDRAIFATPDIRHYHLESNGQLIATCHPNGDLYMRQMHNLVEKSE